MNDQAWSETFATMQAPRDMIEHQTLVVIRDLHLRHEVTFNPLRKHRSAICVISDPATVLDQECSHGGCRYCNREGSHIKNQGIWADDFGSIVSENQKVCARPDWIRQALISGIVFGDESMHDPLRLSLDDFVSLFYVAERYIAEARRSTPTAQYFVILMNGGFKSHANLQVIGREKTHFAYPERVTALCPGDYWQRVKDVHESLGLVIRRDECVAWANLVPVQDRDICAISPSFHDGAVFLHELLQKLKATGSNSFSLVAIPSPNYIAAANVDNRFSSWPAILWRFVDGGDLTVRHSDFGWMESFASASVATDPFLVSGWLNGTITW